MLVYKQTCNKYFNMEIWDNKIIVDIKDIPTDNYNKGKLCFEIVDIYIFNNLYMEIKYKQDITNFFKKL